MGIIIVMDELITTDGKSLRSPELAKRRLLDLARIGMLLIATLAATVPLCILSMTSMFFVSLWTGVALPGMLFSHFDTLPMALGILCYTGLLSCFFLPKTSSIAKFGWIGFAFLAIVSAFAGITSEAIVYLVAAPGFYYVCRLGQAMRAAVPVTFKFDYALAFLAASALPSFFLLFAFKDLYFYGSFANIPVVHQMMPRLLICGITALLGSFGLQACNLATCARTSEAKPLVLLSLLLFSPIILIAFFFPLAAAFNAQMAPLTLHLLAMSFPLALATAAAITLGAYAGAKAKYKKHFVLQDSGAQKLALDGNLLP